MNYRQLLGILFIWFALRFIMLHAFSTFYISAVGQFLSSFIILGSMILISRRILKSQKITFFPTEKVTEEFTRSAIACIFSMYLIEVSLNEIEELLRAGSTQYFATRQVFFGWSLAMKNYYLSVLIAAPILEELFYRGILLRGLLQKYGFKVAIILNSIIFLMMHLEKFAGFNFLISGKLSVAAFSIFVSWITIKSSNIKLAVLLHFIINALAYVFPLIIVVTTINLQNPIIFCVFLGIIMSLSSILLIRNIRILSRFESNRPSSNLPT